MEHNSHSLKPVILCVLCASVASFSFLSSCSHITLGPCWEAKELRKAVDTKTGIEKDVAEGKAQAKEQECQRFNEQQDQKIRDSMKK
jgi:hypothetical protein